MRFIKNRPRQSHHLNQRCKNKQRGNERRAVGGGWPQAAGTRAQRFGFFQLNSGKPRCGDCKTLRGMQVQSEMHRLDVFKADLLGLEKEGLNRPLTTRLALRVREAELVLLIVDLIVCLIHRR